MNHLTQPSRRTVLKGALASGLSLLSFNQLFGFSQLSAQDNEEDPQTIVNLAVTAEMIACTHYYQVLTESNIALAPNEVDMIKGFLDAELQHLELLYENNSVPVATDFYLPLDIYNDREQFSQITEELETTFIAAYLAATRRLAELGQPLLAATAAQVSAIEQEHLALVRSIRGVRPNNLGLARALFFNISEAVPALQPFLAASEEYTGPFKFPGADAIRELVSDVGVVRVPPFTDLTAFDVASSSDTTSAGCTVTPGGDYNCNLRSGPALTYNILGRLAPGETVNVNAQSVDQDGFPWWRLVSGDRWIRSDIVKSTSGDCSTIPTVSV